MERKEKNENKEKNRRKERRIPDQGSERSEKGKKSKGNCIQLVG